MMSGVSGPMQKLVFSLQLRYNASKSAFTHLLMNMYPMRLEYCKDLRELGNMEVPDVDHRVLSQFVDIEVERVQKDTRWDVVVVEELVDGADAQYSKVAVVVEDGAKVEDLDLAARGGDDAALMPVVSYGFFNFYDICNVKNVETIEKNQSRRDVFFETLDV